MKTPDRKQHRDADLSQNPFEEFAPQVRKILRRYRKKRKLASIARQLGFHPARLTEMITKNGNGDYKRKITPHYLAKFIDSGIMDAREILGKRKLEELPERTRGFFERMLASRSTLQLVLEAQRRDKFGHYSEGDALSQRVALSRTKSISSKQEVRPSAAP